MSFSLDRVDRFLRSISSQDRVAIIHDSDPDGVCSAVILAKCIKRLRGRKPELVSVFDKEAYSISEEQVKKLVSSKISKIIVSDFSLDQHIGLVGRLRKLFDVLVIDHHKLYNDINSANVVLVKPQLFCKIDPARYCSAKLAYDLCSRVCDMKDLDWLAAVASIADVATLPWQGWLKSVFKRFGVKWKKDMFKTDFGGVASLINSVVIVDSGRISQAFDVCYRASGPKDVLRSGISKYRKLVDAELDYWLRRFRKCERFDDLYFFVVEPKYNIKSTISTVLGLRYPDKTVLVLSRDNGTVSVSARRGDQRLPVNALLEKAIKGFSQASAGGHIPAAGAHFLAKDLPIFKARVMKLAGELK